jgi:hypothetical protein
MPWGKLVQSAAGQLGQQLVPGQQTPSAWDAAIQGGLGVGMPPAPDWNGYQPEMKAADPAQMGQYTGLLGAGMPTPQVPDWQLYKSGTVDPSVDPNAAMQAARTAAQAAQLFGRMPMSPWANPGAGMPLSFLARGGWGLLPQLLQRVQSQDPSAGGPISTTNPFFQNERMSPGGFRPY